MCFLRQDILGAAVMKKDTLAFHVIHPPQLWALLLLALGKGPCSWHYALEMPYLTIPWFHFSSNMAKSMGMYLEPVQASSQDSSFDDEQQLVCSVNPKRRPRNDRFQHTVMTLGQIDFSVLMHRYMGSNNMPGRKRKEKQRKRKGRNRKERK